MLRKYTILPAILLALGVGDASASTTTCASVIHKGVNVWSYFKDPKDPKDPKKILLCKLFPDEVWPYQDSASKVVTERDDRLPYPWIKVTSTNYNDRFRSCRGQGTVEGYVQEYPVFSIDGAPPARHPAMSCDDQPVR
jgi:hypothetical protein